MHVFVHGCRLCVDSRGQLFGVSSLSILFLRQSSPAYRRLANPQEASWRFSSSASSLTAEVLGFQTCAIPSCFICGKYLYLPSTSLSPLTVFSQLATLVAYALIPILWCYTSSICPRASVTVVTAAMSHSHHTLVAPKGCLADRLCSCLHT